MTGLIYRHPTHSLVLYLLFPILYPLSTVSQSSFNLPSINYPLSSLNCPLLSTLDVLSSIIYHSPLNSILYPLFTIFAMYIYVYSFIIFFYHRFILSSTFLSFVFSPLFSVTCAYIVVKYLFLFPVLLYTLSSIFFISILCFLFSVFYLSAILFPLFLYLLSVFCPPPSALCSDLYPMSSILCRWSHRSDIYLLTSY
jgi:hypothetical protein